MQTMLSLLVLLAIAVAACESHARVLVSTNSTWRYLKGTNEASTPTNAWRQLEFDDSAWLTGVAPFHFGTNSVGGDDNLTGGTILSDMRGGYTCIFLRQTFVIDDTNTVRGLRMNVWFDDGLAIWINGQPARAPIAVVGLAHTNQATSSREAVRTALSLDSTVSLLRNGTNVLCLQGFNAGLEDDDFRIEAELAQPPPTLAFALATTIVPENSGQAVMRVLRTIDVNSTVTVDYTTTNGTALAGQDYRATAGTLTFAPGQTEQSIVVPILNDALPESAESFQLKLGNPGGGASLGGISAMTVQISDGDKGLQFQFPNYTVDEGAGTVLLGIVRGDDASAPVMVEVATSDLTAANGQDYAGTTNILIFADAGRLSLFPVQILNDRLKEVDKSFRVTLRNPDGGALGAQRAATVTILDNDKGFEFELSGYSVAEDAGVALVRVRRGTDETNDFAAVNLATTDQTATNGVDYTGSTNTLTFAPGETAKEVAIPILNDGMKEPTESFRLTLSQPTGAQLGLLVASTATILDNDPGVGFELTRYPAASETSGGFAVAVLRGNDGALRPFSVAYATSDLTARAGQDYEATSGTLEFNDNQTIRTITLPILPDGSVENQESFQVTLSNPTSGALLGAAVSTVDIQDESTPGPVVTVSPPFSTALTIQPGGNRGAAILNWTTGGQLQRADSPAGPWQTLTATQGPFTVQSPNPASFYRIRSSRPVKLHVPSGHDGQTPLPLVVLLHGYGGSGASEEAWWNIRALAESLGFLYCYPDGTPDRWGSRFWNATDGCCNLGESTVDDAGYLRSLIEEVGRRYPLDRKRVFLLGYSNGGYMSYRMACQSADLVAAIASLAGLTFLDADRCRPSEPVNILQVHGTADTVVPYGGGSVPDFHPPSGAIQSPCPGAEQTVAMWASYNGCADPVADLAPSLDLLAGASLDTMVTRYTTFPPGGAVELWTTPGTDHDWANVTATFSRQIVEWLLAHPKP